MPWRLCLMNHIKHIQISVNIWTFFMDENYNLSELIIQPCFWLFTCELKLQHENTAMSHVRVTLMDKWLFCFFFPHIWMQISTCDIHIHVAFYFICGLGFAHMPTKHGTWNQVTTATFLFLDIFTCNWPFSCVN